eukprot:TRINITY_DN9842_c0_g1_i1.p1 TRINITY_DN9842_c0_g1~~TRINITY_DN9842_c0_g1_i1.p1  ORF type:complete len:371 (-),score=76.13 TRINITY_DN9842_c0_g1_i1:52-1164(-)
MIGQCAEQQKTIVDDVLSLSKLENNRRELNPEPFEIDRVIENLMHMFRPQIEKKGLSCTLSIEIPKERRWLKGDSTCLSQILINLLSNAIKFTHKGEITLVVSGEEIINTDQVKLTVTVSDTGIGMLPEEVNGLFDRFAQANRRTASEYGGSGLGLAISQKLVALMGGSIQINSKKWAGTQFCFSVVCTVLTPVERKDVESELPSPSRHRKRYSSNGSGSIDSAVLQKGLTGTKILIAEDNRVNQTILLHFLEQSGCICELANNGLEAWEKYNETSYDFVFMDLEMPVMNGFEATQKIRELERSRSSISRVPIVALSGYTRKELVEEALSSGADDFVTKPYKKEQLFRILFEYMRLDTARHSKRKGVPFS